LQSVVESLDLAASTVDECLKAKDVEENDLEMIRLLKRTDDSLLSGAKELKTYLEDKSDTHFSNFADDMQTVADNMGKASKLIDETGGSEEGQ
jgi:hypothetical protein